MNFCPGSPEPLTSSKPGPEAHSGNRRTGSRVRPFVERHRRSLPALTLGIVLSLAAAAQEAPVRASQSAPEDGRLTRWVVVLDGSPLADQVQGRSELFTARAQALRRGIVSTQARVRGLIMARRDPVKVLGSTQTVLNAFFVAATREQAVDLATLPGVRAVVPAQIVRRAGTKAMNLVNGPKAWDYAGGLGEAGLGSRIGIIDSGIDQTHPAFQDDSLPDPPGGRRCLVSQGECDFTNRKVIAARSYVSMVASSDVLEFTRPDDLSPRDRVGHGTAIAMLAAGVPHDSPIGRLAGVAPKAYLGNYKVFGSPGVNDITFDFVVFQALEDALSDGMDAVTLAMQWPASFGPLDTAPEFCGGDRGQSCDLFSNTVQRVTRLGLAVVAAAGNDGDFSLYLPASGSITRPGTAPGAITVGATTNAHKLTQSLRVTGEDVPEALRRIKGILGNGPRPASALTAPLLDVRQVEDDGRACTPLPRNSLSGAIALIEALGCPARQKVAYAARAGARAVVLMRAEGRDELITPTGLDYTPIPLLLVINSDGKALREFLQANPGREAAIDPSIVETDNADGADLVEVFSSKGPAIGTYELKPDLVAPGSDLFVATQRFDPAADMYDPSGYTVVSGTSFSVGLVAGGVALARQTLPALRTRPENEWAPILKSSVVNTANPDVKEVDPSSGHVVDAPLVSMGNGKLDAFEAMRSPITAAPASVGFGIVNRATFPVRRSLTFTNHMEREIRVTLTVRPWTQDSLARVTVNPTTFTLRAGAVSQPVAVQLEGRVSFPGSYEGVIEAKVENIEAYFQVPYLYLSGDGVPANILAVRNVNFQGIAGRRLEGGLLCKVVDRYGVPVANLPLRWRVLSGGGEIVEVLSRPDGTPATDANGVAEAMNVRLGNQLGQQVFEMEVPNSGLPPVQFVGDAILQPVIETGGVVNAASGRRGQGLAPGSIISILGRGLSEFSLSSSGPGLPLSLGGVSVSFDDPARGISLPGRMVSVSDERVDVQIPWDLAGLSSIKTKVAYNAYYQSQVVDVPLASISPAFWQAEDPETGQMFVDARDEGGARITAANRARRGTLIRLFANGLGPVETPQVTGEPAPADSPVRITNGISVRLGEREVSPEFAGLAAGQAGIYEIRLRLPEDLVTGTQDLTVQVGGVSSPAVRLPIEN